jgi:CRISPR-associated protein Cmr5
MANRAEPPEKAKVLTLEQRRAADAWRCAQDQGEDEDYANLAKGLPVLIMNSGLLQVMAFLNEKGAHCALLGGHLRSWLHNRYHDVPEAFPGFMTALMEADSHKFQAVTTEALSWLRWLRQLAAAVDRREP